MEKVYAFKNTSCLSNFYPVQVEYDGRVYLSSEAAYQSTKTLDKNLRDKFVGLSAHDAKKLGRSLQLREDWQLVMRDMMYDVLLCKYKQSDKCRLILLTTGDMFLKEDTTGWHDNIWGSCSCEKCQDKGLNYLGLELMHVRQTLRDEGYIV